MSEKKFLMGNHAIARGAAEAGATVVAGYPGTPASEIVEDYVQYPGAYVEWAANEKVATEIAIGGSLCNQRSLAVMKHNGTNVATDFIMHLNFTGVKGGMVLLSADDPGANSSQNEEDTRILVHTYGHLPVFDPSTPAEAKAMIKDAYELSEKTELCFVLRPVMRICHARSIIELEPLPDKLREPSLENDRSRYVMSAVAEPAYGGTLRPVIRHRWLNQKQEELSAIMEESPYNWIEEGEGEVGLVGCGIGYSYIKEALEIAGKKLPILKLGTLPLPRQKVIQFLRSVKKVLVYEEVEPVVARMLREIAYTEGIEVEVLGRDNFLPPEGEMSATYVLKSLGQVVPSFKDDLPFAHEPIPVPTRIRSQCVGCPYRGMLHALKTTIRKNKGIVTGDIGCHDAGSFAPMEVQSTIYCMGSSIPMAIGMAKTGIDRPIYAMIGDSTLFHNGIIGLLDAIYNQANVTVIINDNRTTAMTGFQPHPGSEVNVRGEEAPYMHIDKIASAMGAKVYYIEPYDIEATKNTFLEAAKEPGTKVVIAKAPCFLRSSRLGIKTFPERVVKVDPERCNGCKVCINDFGCPALIFKDGKVHIDEATCVHCGLCADVCKRGAIK
ncbi:MAG: 4Fe-4S binding protein [Clostridia bacterium]|nr:4Fe-4S binding protein [Clostridia bacterium]